MTVYSDDPVIQAANDAYVMAQKAIEDAAEEGFVPYRLWVILEATLFEYRAAMARRFIRPAVEMEEHE